MRKITTKGRAIAVILFALVIAIPTALITVFTPNKSEIMVPGNTVMIVDGTKVSAGFFNYFYNAATAPEVLILLEKEYEDFDASKSFSEQIYDEENGTTWHEFFTESAQEQIEKIIALSNKGEAAGLTLLDEQEEEIQAQLAEISKKAAEYGVLANDYASIVYGDFVGKATLEKVMKKSYIAQNYYEYVCVTQKPDKETLKNYLADNEESFYSVSFDYYVVEYEDDFGEQLSLVNKVLEKSNDSRTFDSALKEVFPTYDGWGFLATESVKVNSLLKKDSGYLPQEISNWVFDSKRYTGEKNFIHVSGSKELYVIIMKEPAAIDTEAKCSVREILLDSDDSADSRVDAMYVSEELEKRIRKAENPEYLFAVLADIYLKNYEEMKYSGGMVAKIAFGDSEEKINSWIFDDSRKNGDIISISGENGYYIMFFSDRYEGWMFDVEQELISEKIDSYSTPESVEKAYAYEKHVVNKKTGSDSSGAE